MTTLETIVKEGQSTFIEDRTDTFLASFAQKVVAGVLEIAVPEEIRGDFPLSEKSVGKNEYRVKLLRRLDQFGGGKKT